MNVGLLVSIFCLAFPLKQSIFDNSNAAIQNLVIALVLSMVSLGLHIYLRQTLM